MTTSTFSELAGTARHSPQQRFGAMKRLNDIARRGVARRPAEG